MITSYLERFLLPFIESYSANSYIQPVCRIRFFEWGQKYKKSIHSLWMRDHPKRFVHKSISPSITKFFSAPDGRSSTFFLIPKRTSPSVQQVLFCPTVILSCLTQETCRMGDGNIKKKGILSAADGRLSKMFRT